MTPRESSLVKSLANDVRVMTDRQIAEHWWSGSNVGLCRTRKALRELARTRWVATQGVLARPIVSLSQPLLSWKPGDREPDVETLSARLHRRASQAAELTQVVFATRRSVALFGHGKLATVKMGQMTHDLHVSQLYLRFRSLGFSDRWLSEDQLPAEWPIHTRPDAVLLDANGEIATAIEYGGDYSVARLTELHDGFAGIGAGLCYEIW